MAKERRVRTKKNEKGVSNPPKNEEEAGNSEARLEEEAGGGGGGLAQDEVIKVLQTNLNRSRAAHQLLHKPIKEEEIDVVTISEPKAHSNQGEVAPAKSN
ncbi:hypothetical protein GEV33_000585 [Tenebrio molitor]|uniref:Uncharacterized protein n=1 Tax=Tenebrio molitor TaxID=7067 RepID=A0A8J6HYW5_TENMO|nr:hypothetical protein GEV33_000585 [Tenebrio molitor]